MPKMELQRKCRMCKKVFTTNKPNICDDCQERRKKQLEREFAEQEKKEQEEAQAA